MLTGHSWVLHALGYRSGDRAFDSHHDAERSKLPGERLFFDCSGIPRYRLAPGTGSTLRWVVGRANLGEEGKEEWKAALIRRLISTAARKPNEQAHGSYQAAGKALLALMASNSVGDEVLTRMMHETDLNARASEESVMP